MPKLPIVIAITSGLALSGCAWLPAAGPSTSAVLDAAQKDGVRRYSVVDVDDKVIETLSGRAQPAFHATFGADQPPPAATISVGDTLEVSIWEAGGAALFAAAPALGGMDTGSRQVTIPEQLVLPDGSISIPFAGRISVVGKSPLQLQDAIRNSLAGKASDPQVVVAVTKSSANTVSVTGQAVAGARIALSPRGDRILDLIAAAGGVKTPVYETYIRLTRNGVTATMPFSILLSTPRENIYVWPGDVLTIVQQTQNFVSFGATGRNAEVPFDAEALNLSQALGKASGLLDDRADASGVFLLRYEPRELASALGAAPAEGSLDVPIVYRFDLKDLKSYFYAQRFAVQDKDIVYVAGARGNTIQKFLGLLGSLTNPVVTGVIVTSSVH